MAAGRIELTKGMTAIVSPEDAPLGQRNWQAYKGKSGFYALGKVGVGGKKQKTISLHRVVVGMVPKGFLVDHINGNTLDCRRENLRVVDGTINNRNRVGAQKNSKTGHLGVYKKGSGFGAMIRAGGRQVHLGSFKTLDEAVRARCDAEKRFWGVEPRRKEYHEGVK